MTTTTISFNPCSRNRHTLQAFHILSTKQKVWTCVATAFAILLTLPLLGIGGFPVFITLTRKFSITKPTGLESLFTPFRPLCRNFNTVMKHIDEVSKKYKNTRLSDNEKTKLLRQINERIEKNKWIGKATLSTKFGYCGLAQSLSKTEMEEQKKSSGFVIIMPSENSKIGTTPLFGVHNWETDSWYYTDENGRKKEFAWKSLSDHDGLIFLTKITYQPIQTLRHPKEHNSQFRVANYSKDTDKNTPPFYQEMQIGNYCGKHALNALLGHHHFNKESWGHEDSAGASDVFTAWRAANECKNTNGHFTAVFFDDIGINQLSIKELVQSSDRFIHADNKLIGHWKAYRLDRTTQEWWCIDSMKHERINGQQFLYQYVVEIEKECGLARNTKARVHWNSGIILLLSYKETVQYWLQMLEILKSVASKSTRIKTIAWFDHFHLGFLNFIENAANNERGQNCLDAINRHCSYDAFEDMNEDEFIAAIDEIIAKVALLSP